MEFVFSKKTVAGYSSKLAKQETNDCAVLSIAAVLDLDYKEAHRLVEEKTGRKAGKGTPIWKWFPQWETIPVYNRVIRSIPCITVYGKVVRKMSVGTLFKNSTVKEGRWLVYVSGHIFAIKDGTVYGNPLDVKMLKRPILGLWQVLPSLLLEA